MLFYYINLLLAMHLIKGLTPHKNMLKFVKNARYFKKIGNPIGKNMKYLHKTILEIKSLVLSKYIKKTFNKHLGLEEGNCALMFCKPWVSCTFILS
jgi:hypothetical protein